MSTSDTLYSVVAVEREIIQRGRDQTIRCQVERSGTVQVPTAASVVVFDNAGNEVHNATASIASSGVVSSTINAATTASLVLAEGWVVAWTLTMDDGELEHRIEAALVRTVMRPPATYAHLYERQSRLNIDHRDPIIADDFDLQEKLDAAWREIEGMLVQNGRRPELVMQPSAFRIPHVLLTLALIFEDLAQGDNPQYLGQAADYRAQFSAAWARMSFSYDADEDGQIDGGADPRRQSGDAVTWLSSRRPYSN